MAQQDRLTEAIRQLTRAVESQNRAQRRERREGGTQAGQAGGRRPFLAAAGPEAEVAFNRGPMLERLTRLALRRTGRADISASYGQAGMWGIATTLAIRGTAMGGQMADALTKPGQSTGERTLGVMQQGINVATFGLGGGFFNAFGNIFGMESAQSADQFVRTEMMKATTNAALHGTPLSRDQKTQMLAGFEQAASVLEKEQAETATLLGGRRGSVQEKLDEMISALKKSNGFLERLAGQIGEKVSQSLGEFQGTSQGARRGMEILQDIRDQIPSPR